MINLIPPSAKKGVIKEYWKRVITVWLFLFGITFLILSVFLLPTYVLLKNEISYLEDSVNSSKDKVANYDVSATELVSASSHAKLLLETKTDINPSDLIKKLNGLSGTQVSLNNFQFKINGTEGSITISGLAQTRQALAQFRDQLESDVAFAVIDLPISNLIKDKDLLFSMDIVLATSTKNI